MRVVFVKAEPVPYGVGITCEVESKWHRLRSSTAVAYAVITTTIGNARFPVCPSCWVELDAVAKGEVPPKYPPEETVAALSDQ